MQEDSDGYLYRSVKAKGRIALFCLTVGFGFVTSISAQHRPTVNDETEVRQTSRRTSLVIRTPRILKSAPKAISGLLLIQTDPPDAEIKIDGELQDKANRGILVKQVRGNKVYNISVTAGPEYDEYKETVAVKPGGYEIVDANLVARYGIVRIGPALEGVKITVDGKEVPKDKINIDKDKNTIVINALLPGRRTIIYDHPDYLVTQKVINVSPGVEYMTFLDLKRATAELSVITEPGTKVYVDNVQVGETDNEGKLRYTSINLGKHEIKLVKEGFVTGTGETHTFEYGKRVEIKHPLEPLPTSTEFNENFDIPDSTRWTMPASSGLNRKSGFLYVENTPGLYSPKGIRYRDFTMHFYLKLVNAGGAAWAVRAKDENNYYLFYLSGPQGLFPNQFVTYIIRDGRFDTLKPIYSNPVIVPLTAGGEYEIEIKASKNTIQHNIKTAATGKSEPLGVFPDPNNTFNYGGIGFRTVSTEKFLVDDLYVRP